MTVTASRSTADQADQAGPDTTGRHRAGTVRTGDGLPPIRRQSFLSLVGLELRKSVDTRSGRTLILAILAIAVAALAWQLTHPEDGPASFRGNLGAAAAGVQLILPVIGVMAMTSEWTQRTALTTFTLSPRRTRVQVAKFVAAIVLSAVVLTVTTGLALAATVASGALSGDGVTYAGVGGALAGTYLGTTLNVLMGAAFGALIAQTAVAVLVYFVAPTAWMLAGPTLLGERADWLNVFTAVDRIASRDLTGAVPETLTAVGVWIVLPLVAGLWASSRREVK